MKEGGVRGDIVALRRYDASFFFKGERVTVEPFMVYKGEGSPCGMFNVPL